MIYELFAFGFFTFMIAIFVRELTLPALPMDHWKEDFKDMLKIDEDKK